MSAAFCGHQICELIVLLQREGQYGEPSRDDYAREPSSRCYIKEPSAGEPRPHIDDSSADDAVRHVEQLHPTAVAAEIERLHMLRAARALAKFISTKAGNRELLRAQLQSAVDEHRMHGQNTEIAQERLDRLYGLGILKR